MPLAPTSVTVRGAAVVADGPERLVEHAQLGRAADENGAPVDRSEPRRG